MARRTGKEGLHSRIVPKGKKYSNEDQDIFDRMREMSDIAQDSDYQSFVSMARNRQGDE